MQIVINIPKDRYNTIVNYADMGKELTLEQECIYTGMLLPDDCEILTKEAYEDLCHRASNGG